MTKQVLFGDLPNGMRFYNLLDRAIHMGGIGVGCGSVYDPRGKRGMAHFVEHVLARESSRYSERDAELLFRRYMGGPDDDINIRTDYVSTFFGCSLLLRRRYMKAVFDVMASMLHPKERVLDVEGAKVELAAVHQEYYLRGVDWIEGLVWDLLHEAMYEKNPVRNRIDCDPKELEQFTLRDVKRFVERYYVPKNMFVVLLGPSFQEAREMVERYFGDWDARTTPRFDYDHEDDFPVLTGIRSLEMVRRGIYQYHTSIGFPTESWHSEDGVALDVMSQILEFRLHERLRNQNKNFGEGVYRVYVNTERSFVHGLIAITFATQSKSFRDRAEAIVREEIDCLKRRLVTQEEIDAIKERLDAEYLSAFYQGTLGLCEMVIDSAVNGDGDLVKFHSFRKDLKKVTRRKVLAVANKYFTEYYARAVVKPR